MANRLGGKGEKLAKAALSVSRTKVTITGEYEEDRQKFGAMTQDFAITFDGNNNVLVNGIKNDVTSNTNALLNKEDSFAKNTAFNKDFGTSSSTVCQGNDIRLFDSRTPLSHNHTISNVTGLQTIIDDYESRIAALETLLTNYTSHTHDYDDGTINDTDDGTGTQTDTTRTTTGVN